MRGYDEQPMTTGQWFLTLLVMSIPVVNLIAFIVWALGAGNRSRVTYCRACILLFVVAVVAYLLLLFMFPSALVWAQQWSGAGAAGASG